MTPITHDQITRGRLVVHAIHGLGQIVGYDPPNSTPRYVTVRFGTSMTGVVDMLELFAVGDRR